MNFNTYVNPQKTQTTALSKAFDQFLEELQIDPQLLPPENPCLKINTIGKYDNIMVDDKHTFSKETFLSKKDFRRKLETYYNEKGFYITQPEKISPKIKIWKIELLPYRPSRKKYSVSNVFNN